MRNRTAWMVALLLMSNGISCDVGNRETQRGPAGSQRRSAVPPSSAINGRRIALLIGNQAYAREVGELDNPVNDVNLLAKSLQSIGFKKEDVEVVQDVGRVAMLAAVDRHARRLASAGKNAVGFLYYSGHGAGNRQDKQNYLIPVGVGAPRRRRLV